MLFLSKNLPGVIKARNIPLVNNSRAINRRQDNGCAKYQHSGISGWPGVDWVVQVEAKGEIDLHLKTRLARLLCVYMAFR